MNANDTIYGVCYRRSYIKWGNVVPTVLLAFCAGFFCATLLFTTARITREECKAATEAELEARIALEVNRRVSVIVDSMTRAMTNYVNKSEVENVIH